MLLLARELKLLHVGVVSVDGTKIDANASKHRSVRYDRAKALVEQLRMAIAELLNQAEQAEALWLKSSPGQVRQHYGGARRRRRRSLGCSCRSTPPFAMVPAI